MQYAGWYKEIYAMPFEFRPDDEMIADDKRLDAWYETFLREQARRAGRKGDPRFAILGDAGSEFQVPEFGV